MLSLRQADCRRFESVLAILLLSHGGVLLCCGMRHVLSVREPYRHPLVRCFSLWHGLLFGGFAPGLLGCGPRTREVYACSCGPAGNITTDNVVQGFEFTAGQLELCILIWCGTSPVYEPSIYHIKRSACETGGMANVVITFHDRLRPRFLCQDVY
jgi:hypothetical protein